MWTSSIQASLAALALSAISWSAQAADVGVSIRVGDPDFYGQLEIGERFRPRVIYEQPQIIHRTRYVYEPVYLRVPPGHARHWSRHCGRYRACARPVYFVQDGWYRDTYRHRGHWRDRNDWHKDHRGHRDDGHPRHHGRHRDD
ncbi:hypothetical protein [Chitinibacter sp. GC72]|uniref:hypothetical protein n=1 Tax=Chitinibacter sp. GC72 TaxID=1526917 RepID=UPI0012F768DD|nr:hypothetical protein [Chitinibacter sp. GC72]